MDPDSRRLIEALHQAPYKCVLALSGGGTTAVAQLLEVPGGSRTILEVLVAYGENALVGFLGRRPDQFCSAQVSRDMARRAYERASWLAPGALVVGLGCTASLASDRPKRGDHRVHVSFCSSDSVNSYSLILTKSARHRSGEEAVVDQVILMALARALRIGAPLEISLLPEEKLEIEDHDPGGQHVFFAGNGDGVWVAPDGQRQALGKERKIGAVLPGSFNPVHEGHWALAATAERLVSAPVVFELSVNNADKPGLPEEEVRRRLTQFAWRAPVVLTREPIFAQKARLFPGAAFVVGADTAMRIIAPRYYSNEAALTAALQEIRAHNCRFLVAGRVDAGGEYLGLDDLAVPAEFRDLFTAIPAIAFRLDLSSTELRARDHHAAQEKAESAG
jgi:hypothetical protein